MRKTTFSLKVICFLTPLLVLNAFTNVAYGQREHYNWNFGKNASIHFSDTGLPVVGQGSAMNTEEGCASISDGMGNLLFYSNGVTVWNAKNEIMEGGERLIGHASATQSSIIVPKPSSPNIYYLFSVDWMGNEKGLHYSLVDMQANGGYGKVTQSNEFLTDSISEKIVAVRHENEKDYWIVVRKWGASNYNSFLLTENGIDHSRTVSSKSIQRNLQWASQQSPIGQMKVSSDGKRIALVHFGTNIIELANFNKATGKVTNVEDIGDFWDKDYIYGIEFSASGRFLYVSNRSPNGEIAQFDLDQERSRRFYQVVGTSGYPSSLQLGPDRKIYVAQMNAQYLSVIESPELEGVNCDFNKDALRLNHGQCLSGLPNFSPHHFENPHIRATNICPGDSTSFNVSVLSFDSIEWDFGDVDSSKYMRYKAHPPVKHLYKVPATYTVTARVFISGNLLELQKKIQIQPNYAGFLGEDFQLCAGESRWLTPSIPGAQYVWSGTKQSDSFLIDRSSTVYAKALVEGCSYRDTLNVLPGLSRKLYIDPIVLVCEGDSLLLHTFPEDSVTWENGVKGEVFTFTEPGVHFFVAKSGDCEQRYEFELKEVKNELQFELPDTMKCDLKEYAFKVPDQSVYVLWSTGSTELQPVLPASGTYWLSVNDNYCSFTDSFYFDLLKCLPQIDLPNVFSPNGDGFNDVFTFLNKDRIVHNHMEIYNRWGQQVFETERPKINWTGENLAAGTYFWVLTYEDVSGVVSQKKGTVQLVR